MISWKERRERKEWSRSFVNEIVKFYGEGCRRQAEDAAVDYLSMQSVKDDPIGAAVLVMEGWSYAQLER